MVVVHDFNERLHLGSSLDFLLAHSSGNFKSISFDACNESVSEFLVLKKRLDEKQKQGNIPSFRHRTVSQ
jgi:hypothetical protein